MEVEIGEEGRLLSDRQSIVGDGEQGKNNEKEKEIKNI